MPILLRPSAERCLDFMSHSNSYTAHLPPGYELYFTLPFDLASLDPMRPQELEAISDFLDVVQHEAAESLGNHTLENVLQVQQIISRRLEDSKCLGDLEIQGWIDGHGLPVFDEFQYPVDFHWNWDVIEFKGLNSNYFNLVHPASAGILSHSIYRTSIKYTAPPPNTMIDRSPYASANRNHMHSESGRPVSMYGATFADTNEILDFSNSYTDDDIALLKEQVIQLEGDSHRGIRRIWGPNADSHFEWVPQGSWIDVEIIEQAKTQEHNSRTRKEAKKGSTKAVQRWEDFYQRKLISYGLTSKINTLVPHTDLHLLKLYKAMRDQSSSERDIMQKVTDLRWIGPTRFPRRPIWNDDLRCVEERSTYLFPNNPGSSTPQVIIQQATTDSNPKGPADDTCLSAGSRMRRVQDADQGLGSRFQIVQPPSSQEVNQSSFTNQSEPQYVYVYAPSAHHQSATVHERDSLFSPGHESKRMDQTRVSNSLSESERKELNRIHSKAGERKVFYSSAAHESNKAKERSCQKTAQQASHFQDHNQQAFSPSLTQAAIKKSEHTSNIVHQQALSPRRTMSGVNLNAYRTRSFQEPTRLSIRPRAAARPSSSYAGLNDSDRSNSHESSYQAYAEDSPEDSPRAASDSWRDV